MLVSRSKKMSTVSQKYGTEGLRVICELLLEQHDYNGEFTEGQMEVVVTLIQDLRDGLHG
jgi:hypothetical protein